MALLAGLLRRHRHVRFLKLDDNPLGIVARAGAAAAAASGFQGGGGGGSGVVGGASAAAAGSPVVVSEAAVLAAIASGAAAVASPPAAAVGPADDGVGSLLAMLARDNSALEAVSLRRCGLTTAQFGAALKLLRAKPGLKVRPARRVRKPESSTTNPQPSTQPSTPPSIRRIACFSLYNPLYFLRVECAASSYPPFQLNKQ